MSSGYTPDPRILYKCVYCNESARLADSNVVVDGYKNVIHLACFDKEVSHVLEGKIGAESK